MSCCGHSRRSMAGSRVAGAVSPLPPTPRGHGGAYRVFFEYVGRTALTVDGPASGRRYRFPRPGARLEADLRDRPSLAAVPHLREIRV